MDVVFAIEKKIAISRHVSDLKALSFWELDAKKKNYSAAKSTFIYKYFVALDDISNVAMV